MKTNHNAQEHITSNHELNKPTYTCVNCWKVFDSQELMEEHMISHSETCDADPKWFTCEICAAAFEDLSLLEDHKRTNHKEGRKEAESLENQVKLEEIIKSLKSENISIKNEKIKTEQKLSERSLELEQLRALGCAKCKEKFTIVNKLNEHIEEAEIENKALVNDLDKLKKDKTKSDKEVDKRIKEMKTELTKCYSDVDKYYQENIKLSEHNKTLEEVLKVNNDLHFKLKRIEEKLADEEVEEEILIVEDNHENNQPTNGNTGTIPKEVVNHPCNKCDFTANTMGLLRRHAKQKHTCTNPTDGATALPLNQKETRQEIDKERIKCDKCTFISNSKEVLMKHLDEKHTSLNYERICRFWQRGDCTRGQNCNFSHGQLQEQNTTRPCFAWARGSCTYGDSCKYFHNSIPNNSIPNCRFQNDCYNWPNCRFLHQSSNNEKKMEKYCQYQDFPMGPQAQRNVPFSQW